MEFTDQCMPCLKHQDVEFTSLSLSLSHTHTQSKGKRGKSGTGTADFGLALINPTVLNSFAIIILLVLQSASSQLNR